MRSTRDYMADQIAELTAERDALASELSRLRTLEAAAIEWFTADGEARYEASHKWWPLVIEACAEKARKT